MGVHHSWIRQIFEYENFADSFIITVPVIRYQAVTWYVPPVVLCLRKQKFDRWAGVNYKIILSIVFISIIH